VQYFQELKVLPVEVYRNDQISIAEIKEKSPKVIIISPGPGTPREAGISLSVIHAFKGRIPILGVCLGHQAIGEACGGKVVQADHVMHGKTSYVYHSG
jgi:anthranilate synthase component 2